jgi:hypothetical protein
VRRWRVGGGVLAGVNRFRPPARAPLAAALARAALDRAGPGRARGAAAAAFRGAGGVLPVIEAAGRFLFLVTGALAPESDSLADRPAEAAERRRALRASCST